MRSEGGGEISVLTLAGAYVGTVVGAGFASGQEVLQFFGYFGWRGYLGIGLATVLFAFFGYLILRLGREMEAQSHRELMRRVGGPHLGGIIDGIVTVFLFGALTVMAAGSGAIFAEQFGLPSLLGALIMLGGSLGTVLLGLHGVITAISLIAPVLLLAVVSIAVASVYGDPGQFTVNFLHWSEVGRTPVPSWPVAAVLYLSYNLVLAVPVLAPMGVVARPGSLKTGAVLGGLGLGVGVAAINSAVLTRVPAAAEWEVPMLVVAGGISPLVRVAFTAVLFAEIYSTAVASLYGFVARLGRQSAALSPTSLAVITSAAALAAAQLGFSAIVSLLFPAVGGAGLLLVGALVWGAVRPLVGRLPVTGRGATRLR
ncbi:MAG: hypothetical protein R6U70_09200 [Bacillota bacterium]